jgi:Anti-sigma factor NepR
MRTLPNHARQTVRRAIGEQLRAAYEETVQEPTPSRHLYLLQQLERNETVQNGTCAGRAHRAQITGYKRLKGRTLALIF